MTSGVYMIENNINHNKYIGASKHIEVRFKEHIRDAFNNQQPNSILYRAIRKYGIDNFSFTIIEECPEDIIFEREKYWIEYYDTYNNGYNATTGGEGCPDAYHPIGDDHPNSLITEETAKLIIQDLISTRLKFLDIANKYGCSEDIVKDINCCKTHKYLHTYSKNIREENGITRISSFEKLTVEEVYDIINLLITTDKSYREIGKLYGVSGNTVSRINKCQTWKTLHNYKNNIREEAHE